ncbi:MAG TPA: PAS domain S-box protein [Spirochaetota bacterium]|nr:PAS domain S-box protein [Spirochaetota bacterium]HPI88698.1 PAS domain S-box protein [Spirochaetota bacterium]HPR48780.1 PAS domain S-box protein [Spirochaetota bacterium]
MKNFRITSIGKKVIGVYLIMISTIITLGIISFNHLRSLDEILSREVIKKADARYLCKNIILQSKYIHTQVEGYIRSQDLSKKRASLMIINDTMRLIREYRAQISNMNLTPEEKAVIKKIDGMFNNYYRMIEEILKYYKNTTSGGKGLNSLLEKFTDTHSLLTTQLLILERVETRLMHEAQDNAKNKISSFKIQIFIFCIIFTFIGILLSIIPTRSVTRPINNLVTVLEQYGRGDTKVRARVDTWDEIGFFASRFNQMLENIEKKNAQLRESNETLQEKNIELKRSEKRYRLLAENVNDVIWTTDTTLNPNFISPSFEKLSGYTVSEFWNLRLKDILTEKSYAETVAFYHEEMNLKKNSRGNLDRKTSHIVDFISKSGKIIPVETSLSLIIDSKSRTIEILGVSRDISERKQAEEKIIQQYNEIQQQYIELEAVNMEINRAHEEVLKASENFSREKERLSTTLKSITDGVITTDTRGNIELMNSAAEMITSWTLRDASGMGIDRVLNIVNEKTGAHIENPVQEILNSATMIEFEKDITLIDRNALRKNIEAAGAPVIDKDGNNYGAVLVIRDITEKIKMEAELVKAQKIDSLGVFAAGIAHDFNNLLTAIIGNISLARLTVPEDASVSQILEEAENISLRARELTTQLLTFSKGGAPIKKLTSLNSLLSDTANFVLSGSNVKAELSLPEDLWNAEIDETQISQVVHNIILNARQAMPEGGYLSITADNVHVGPTAKIPLHEGKYIKIAISDQGIGIPEENIQKIFDPYFTTKTLGSGLGLTITYSIIKKHDGHISVESGPGEGTMFTIYLPASEKKYTDIRNKQVAGEVKGGRLLLMDDDEAVLDVTEKMLVKLGFEVSRARTGEEAIALYEKAFFENRRYDVVIMDLTIPGGMGGKKAVEAIIKIDPNVRAVVSSGYSNDPVMANYRDYGFCGVVVKPFRFNELVAVLSKI